MQRPHLSHALLLLPLFFASRSVSAHETKEDPPEAPRKPVATEVEPIEVTVVADKPASEAASRVHVGRRELMLRPKARPGSIIEAVPGLLAVQHAGGGKANQYFLRGFDADHGTDVAFFVDGVPINMPSHGHGQGFTDLHFIIPELVVSLDGYKGPYYAQLGDFATAGAVDMRLAERFGESFAQYSIGQYGLMRGLVIESPDLGEDWRMVAAAELYKADGPFLNPERLGRYNLFFRLTHDLGHNATLSATWMSYGAGWNANGQIPARAVCDEGEPLRPRPSDFGEPCLDRFGAIDPTEGGASARHQGQVALRALFANADLEAMAYMVKYRFSLYSNFTFFADDPIHGDQIEQNDDRLMGGMKLRYRRHHHYLGGQFTTSLGADARVDSIDNALRHDEARERLEDRTLSQIDQSQIGLYVEEDARVRPWLRFIAGARIQRADVGVDDRLEDRAATGNASSGSEAALLFLPKFSAVLSPRPWLHVYGHFGRGFHSNDARGAVLQRDPARLLTPATGYEIGVKGSPFDDLWLHATGFLLDLDSELVWSGDEGTTEASGQTRRYGVELGGRLRIENWLFADLDFTYTESHYRDTGEAVPLAPRTTLSMGIGARPRYGDFTPFGAVRMRVLGERAAMEDGSLEAEGFTIIDASVGLRWKNLEGGLDVQNLGNASWREVQFANRSRLSYEPTPVTGLHYSPGWPLTVMGRVAYYWQ